MRQLTIKDMERVRNDESLTDEEKYNRIVELATALGKTYFDNLTEQKFKKK